MKHDAQKPAADAAPKRCDDDLGDELGALAENVRKTRIALKVAGISSLAALIVLIVYIVTGLPLLADYLSLSLYMIMISGTITSICWIKIGVHNQKIRELADDAITSEELGKVFEVTSFSPIGSINELRCHPARLPVSWDKICGSSYVVGKHRGVQFEFCNVDLIILKDMGRLEREMRLVWVIRVTLSFLYMTFSRRMKFEEIQFRGQWLIVTLAKTAKSRVVVSTMYGTSNNALLPGGDYRGKYIKTENAAFNERFAVIADDTLAAFHVLTPSMIDYIFEVDQMVGAQTHFCFDSNRLHIFLGTWHESFHAGEDAKDILALRTRIQSEVRSLADFLDMLIRNDELFSREP